MVNKNEIFGVFMIILFFGSIALFGWLAMDELRESELTICSPIGDPDVECRNAACSILSCHLLSQLA